MGLKERRFGTSKAQDRNGAIQITIPADAVRDLGIEGGDEIAIGGNTGDESLRVTRADMIEFP